MLLFPSSDTYPLWVYIPFIAIMAICFITVGVVMVSPIRLMWSFQLTIAVKAKKYKERQCSVRIFLFFCFFLGGGGGVRGSFFLKKVLHIAAYSFHKWTSLVLLTILTPSVLSSAAYVSIRNRQHITSCSSAPTSDSLKVHKWTPQTQTQKQWHGYVSSRTLYSGRQDVV